MFNYACRLRALASTAVRPCFVCLSDEKNETEFELKTKLLTADRTVGKEVKRLKLKLSTKSKIIPSSYNGPKKACHVAEGYIDSLVVVTLEEDNAPQPQAATQARRLFHVKVQTHVVVVHVGIVCIGGELCNADNIEQVRR